MCYFVDEVLEPNDEDIEGVSVGGMDVSDIEEEDQTLPMTSRGPPVRGGAHVAGPAGLQSVLQPAPPKYVPRPPGSFNPPAVSVGLGLTNHCCLNQDSCENCLL